MCFFFLLLLFITTTAAAAAVAVIAAGYTEFFFIYQFFLRHVAYGSFGRLFCLTLVSLVLMDPFVREDTANSVYVLCTIP